MKKYLAPIIIAVLLIGIGSILAYRQYHHAYPAPKLTQGQKDHLNQDIKKANQEIANKDDKVAYYGYLDKADALRQLGNYDQALDGLAQAYKRNADWQGTAPFMVMEARIWGGKDLAEGTKRYEELLKKFASQSTDYYREYINFLKQHNQDPHKIASVYQAGAAATKDSALYKEFHDYVVDNHLE